MDDKRMQDADSPDVAIDRIHQTERPFWDEAAAAALSGLLSFQPEGPAASAARRRAAAFAARFADELVLERRKRLAR